jgi:triosephosphate isomerase
MARTPIIVGNWKLNKTVAESVALARAVADGVVGITGVEVGVAPVATALHPVAAALTGTSVHLGAQNCYPEPAGAFTGEMSVPLLKDVGCSLVIIGHSERRQYFGETDAFINQKAKAVLAGGLTPIVCVGETLEQRERQETFTVVGTQVRGTLAGLSAEQIAITVIAYEPVWAIGTGRTATDAQAQEVHAYIRGILRELSPTAADAVRIQYGGSVKGSNAAGLLAQPDIDGALVGGASLKAEDFVAIVQAAAQRRSAGN